MQKNYRDTDKDNWGIQGIFLNSSWLKRKKKRYPRRNFEDTNLQEKKTLEALIKIIKAFRGFFEIVHDWKGKKMYPCRNLEDSKYLKKKKFKEKLSAKTILKLLLKLNSELWKKRRNADWGIQCISLSKLEKN